MHIAVTSSDLLAASGVVYNKPCKFMGMDAIADGTNAAIAQAYDNATTNSGKTVGIASIKATDTMEASSAANISAGVICNKGLYLQLTGTGAKAIVYFSPMD